MHPAEQFQEYLAVNAIAYRKHKDEIVFQFEIDNSDMSQEDLRKNIWPDKPPLYLWYVILALDVEKSRDDELIEDEYDYVLFSSYSDKRVPVIDDLEVLKTYDVERFMYYIHFFPELLYKNALAEMFNDIASDITVPLDHCSIRVQHNSKTIEKIIEKLKQLGE
jgi:hypothetical protein